MLLSASASGVREFLPEGDHQGSAQQGPSLVQRAQRYLSGASRCARPEQASSMCSDEGRSSEDTAQGHAGEVLTWDVERHVRRAIRQHSKLRQSGLVAREFAHVVGVGWTLSCSSSSLPYSMTEK